MAANLTGRLRQPSNTARTTSVAPVTISTMLTMAGATLTAIAALLLGGQAVSAVGIYPHFLAYFSPIVGGPAQGYQHLVDSSLDWGQDLPGLKHWLDQNRRPGEPVYLSYFGTGEPDHYGIEAVGLPGIFHFRRMHPW